MWVEKGWTVRFAVGFEKKKGVVFDLVLGFRKKKGLGNRHGWHAQRA